MTKTIYTLEMHEAIPIGEWIVMRVPGGWIHSFTQQNFIPNTEHASGYYHLDTHSVFVPLSTQAKEEQMETLLER